MAAEAMDAFTDRLADRAVRSVFIYTREAHPGENYRHHTSMDDKRRNARAFQSHSKVKRQILLDTLSGDAHQGYGILPNMTWIMGRGGPRTNWCRSIANGFRGVPAMTPVSTPAWSAPARKR